jgi:hypothetical protein
MALRQLEEDASALLGEHYTKLVAQRTRGLDSRHPPTNPHRLVDAIRRVAASRHNLEAGKGLVDAEAIVEVRTLLVFAERWRNDALWPELQNSLRDPNQYVQTLLLLAAHHVWSVAGNVVDLKRADGTTRTFDLSMQDLGHSMAAEVKAPLKLRRGGKPPLKVLAAKDVVLDAIRLLSLSSGHGRPSGRSQRLSPQGSLRIDREVGPGGMDAWYPTLGDGEPIACCGGAVKKEVRYDAQALARRSCLRPALPKCGCRYTRKSRDDSV